MTARARMDREFLIAELQRWARENGGRAPGRLELNRSSGFPSSMPFEREFGSWGAAVVAAGFPAPLPGRPARCFAPCPGCGEPMLKGAEACADCREGRNRRTRSRR